MTVTLPGLVVAGRTEAERAEAAAAVKATIAFYGSTPAYRPVLELHGWESLADELHALSVSRREDKWTAMRDLVDDEVLGTFAVVAEPEDVAAHVRDRYTGWSTGSASTPPIPPRWSSGIRWSPPSADRPLHRRGPPLRHTGYWESLSVPRGTVACPPAAPSRAPCRRLVTARPRRVFRERRIRGTAGRRAPGRRRAAAGEVVDVVVSVAQWGEIARELVGDCGTVTTIIASAAVDPHDFEAVDG